MQVNPGNRVLAPYTRFVYGGRLDHRPATTRTRRRQRRRRAERDVSFSKTLWRGIHRRCRRSATKLRGSWLSAMALPIPTPRLTERG